MHESLLLGVATVFVLVLGAQWIAWRFRLPSILLLLVLTALVGPVEDEKDRALLDDMIAGESRAEPLASSEAVGPDRRGAEDPTLVPAPAPVSQTDMPA